MSNTVAEGARTFVSRDAYLEACLRGEALYGDDFSEREIELWFRDEECGYAELGAGDRSNYQYAYHALNQRHGFRHLPEGRFDRCLGFGSAYGDELLPIVHVLGRITIVDPADGFQIRELHGVPVRYLKPRPSGKLDLPSDHFDLVTCFSALHHIPNVTAVVRELFRCLKHGGFCLLKEPIISMGDWRRPRKGLTLRERGLPLPVFRKVLCSTGFEIRRERLCMFSLTSRLRYVMRQPVYNSPWAVALDSVITALPIWSRRYHPLHPWHKLRPSAVYYVLQKPA